MPDATVSCHDAGPSAEVLVLDGVWQLRDGEGGNACPIAIPGDVHSALLAAALIPDPYFGANEAQVQWVARRDWVLSRTFELRAVPGYGTLTLDEVDCLADVYLNGVLLGSLENQFRRHRFEVAAHLVNGSNELRLHFHDAVAEAQRRHAAHPFELPYTMGNDRQLPINLLRKTQCAGGWDWNICLMPIGIYGEVSLRRSGVGLIGHVGVQQQHHEGGTVDITVVVEVHGYGDGQAELDIEFDGVLQHQTVAVRTGATQHVQTFTVAAPQLWWPAGQGTQTLYPLRVRLDDMEEQRRIGLRTIALITEKDDIGTTMKFRVNGRDIFCKGANWIPGDALPGRITPQVVVPQLEAAVAANMNMVRVWGGGNYEKEWFYDACDTLGLLVWQDFMFSCMHYPSDRAFLAEVQREAQYQVKRLQHRACLALWCGDNELIGAIDWYDASKANRDRYLVNYDRLNRTLQQAVEDFDPSRRFWTSSPSLGELDFSDGWHCDTRGDMHFWDVWHSAEPFEHYRTVQPRFCSEFGFQSFPSLACIESFTTPDERNVSSPVMEVHQRNSGGNARILETMTRNFRFPGQFDQMILLSQIQQGLAMKTAIDYWRSLKPRCMGTLYWQLNDTWPVASWSGIEYGGRWKVLHYMARRFYAPVTVISVPHDDGAAVRLVAVSDVPTPVALRVDAIAVSLSGSERVLWQGSAKLNASAGQELVIVPCGQLAEDEFIQIRWRDSSGEHRGQDDYLTRFYKAYALPKAQPRLRIVANANANAHAHAHADADADANADTDADADANADTGANADAGANSDANAALTELHLETDAPCFFTWLDTSIAGQFSDNAFTLLPGQPRVISWRGAPLTEADIRICHLGSTY